MRKSEQHPLDRYGKKWLPLTLIALAIVQASLLVYGALSDSPTLNEPAHLAAGLYHLENADFSLYRVNPPLIRVIAACPVKIVGYKSDWSTYFDGIGARPEFELGKAFVAANGTRSLGLFSVGRLAVIPFTLLGTLVSFCWARELSKSTVGGLVAAFLWGFDPFTLGHGCLLTPDCQGAALGIAAGYTFWRFLRKPTWRRAIVSGMMLGLSMSVKLTFVVLLPLWPLIWMIYRLSNTISIKQRDISTHQAELLSLRSKRQIPRPEARMLFVSTFLAIYVLNLCYLGQGFGVGLGRFCFVSSVLKGTHDQNSGNPCNNRFVNSWLGSIPVPFPKDFVMGVDLQQRDFEQFEMPSYARGQWSNTGWWWYYLYALLVKEPIGTLALFGLAIGVCAGRVVQRLEICKRTRTHSFGRRTANSGRDLFVTLVPAAVILAIVSWQSGFSEHSRYVLPSLPFLYVSIGMQLGIADREYKTSTLFRDAREATHWEAKLIRETGLSLRNLIFRFVAGFFLFLVVFESLWSWPNSIAFFNFGAGGPAAGPSHLLGSNVDWGQDLRRLNDWAKKSIDPNPIHLAYNEVMYDVWDLADDRFSSWPLQLGMRIDEGGDLNMQPKVPDGLYAVAVGLLFGSTDSVRRRDDVFVAPNRVLMRRLRDMKPTASIGQTVRVFTSEQIRMALLQE